MRSKVLQPAAVSVYEYHDGEQPSQGFLYEKLHSVEKSDSKIFSPSAFAERPCVKFYHPERRDGQLMQLCQGTECQCAEGNNNKMIN